MITTGNPNAERDTIGILDHEFPTSSSFKYLSAIGTDSNDINEEIKARLGNGFVFAKRSYVA